MSTFQYSFDKILKHSCNYIFDKREPEIEPSLHICLVSSYLKKSVKCGAGIVKGCHSNAVSLFFS